MGRYTLKRRSKATSRVSRGGSFTYKDAIEGYVIKSAPPEGGWTHENFVGDARKRLRASMVQVQRLALINASRTLTPQVTAFLEGTVENVIKGIDRVYRAMYGMSVKEAVEVEVNAPVHEGIWATVIDQELDKAGLAAAVVFEPAIRNVMDDIHNNVSVMLGSQPNQRQLTALGIRSRELARKVGRISETTRTRLKAELAYSIKNNLTVFEAIGRVRDRTPVIATNRVPTIVRTEMGRAADEAVKNSMKWSGVVTHFDVVGCASIEPNIPTLFGVPTCNIERVPIEYESQISFHPNHTGAIVASSFRKADGSVPQVRPMGNAPTPDPDDGF